MSPESSLPRKPALVARPQNPLSPTPSPGPDLRQVWPELLGRGGTHSTAGQRSGDRVTHSDGDGTNDSSQVALDELGCRRRLEGRDRFPGSLDAQSSHTPPLPRAPASKRRSCPPADEWAKVPLEAKGTRASLCIAPDMEMQGGNVPGESEGSTALLPCSQELPGRPCWLEGDNGKGQNGTSTAKPSRASGGTNAGRGLLAPGSPPRRKGPATPGQLFRARSTQVADQVTLSTDEGCSTSPQKNATRVAADHMKKELRNLPLAAL